jgi:hypothetical protein
MAALTHALSLQDGFFILIHYEYFQPCFHALRSFGAKKDNKSPERAPYQSTGRRPVCTPYIVNLSPEGAQYSSIIGMGEAHPSLTFTLSPILGFATGIFKTACLNLRHSAKAPQVQRSIWKWVVERGPWCRQRR